MIDLLALLRRLPGRSQTVPGDARPQDMIHDVWSIAQHDDEQAQHVLTIVWIMVHY